MKKFKFILLIILIMSNNLLAFNKDEAMKATASAGVGAGVGYGVVAASGMTAAAMAGSGAGIGAAAGPVGAAIGATVGLAAYGVYKVFETPSKTETNNKIESYY